MKNNDHRETEKPKFFHDQCKGKFVVKREHLVRDKIRFDPDDCSDEEYSARYRNKRR